MSKDRVRPTAVAGSFYPQSKVVLERDLSLFLENSPDVHVSKSIKAIVVPHAGYMYSGGVAARAYRPIISLNFDFIVVLAPSHFESYPYVSIYPGKAFATPLGDIPIEQEVTNSMMEQDSIFKLSESGYSSREHSLEVQLPLLKWVQDSPWVVPLMMGEQSKEIIEKTSRVLTEVVNGKKCLIIASTDLSHYHPNGEARSLDQVVMNRINAYLPDQLFEDIINKRCEMCGYGPAIVAMNVARELGASEAKVLLYRNSGDMTGDMDQVVGYLSAIIY